jgi:hypothetical protein
LRRKEIEKSGLIYATTIFLWWNSFFTRQHNKITSHCMKLLSIPLCSSSRDPFSHFFVVKISTQKKVVEWQQKKSINLRDEIFCDIFEIFAQCLKALWLQLKGNSYFWFLFFCDHIDQIFLCGISLCGHQFEIYFKKSRMPQTSRLTPLNSFRLFFDCFS